MWSPPAPPSASRSTRARQRSTGLSNASPRMKGRWKQTLLWHRHVSREGWRAGGQSPWLHRNQGGGWDHVQWTGLGDRGFPAGRRYQAHRWLEVGRCGQAREAGKIEVRAITPSTVLVWKG